MSKVISNIRIEFTGTGREAILYLKPEDSLSIEYDEYKDSDYTRPISVQELFDLVTYSGDRLKKVADEALQKQIDEWTATGKKMQTELKASLEENWRLKAKIQALTETIKIVGTKK
jgi:hypothetical protein